MCAIPESDVRAYVALSDLFTNGEKRNTVIFIADGGNHFTHYGIFEGMFLIFDLDAKFLKGHLSCFFNETPEDEQPKYRVSDVPIKGYQHMGRLIASVRNYEV